MKKELDDKLCRDFPKLYADRFLSPQETCMYFGFECSNGWFDLIYELSSKLEAINNAMTDPTQHIRASQVKEKFGGLRFYVGFATEEAHNLISEAESKSYEICEECGKPGTDKGSTGWITTLCPEHREEDTKRRVERAAEFKKTVDTLKEKGQTTVEYLLIIAVIVVTISVFGKTIAKPLGATLQKVFSGVDAKVHELIDASIGNQK